MHWETEKDGATPDSRPPTGQRSVAVKVLVAAAVLALLAIAIGAVLVLRGDDDEPNTTSAATTSTVATEPAPEGAVDTRSDVEVVTCTADPGPKVRITNSTDRPVRYLVVVKVSVDGESKGTAGAQVPAIEPGASTEATLQAPGGIPDGADCTVQQVIRTPS